MRRTVRVKGKLLLLPATGRIMKWRGRTVLSRKHLDTGCERVYNIVRK